MKWSELDEVKRNLAQYVMNFETLHGRQFVTLNIHHLLHISECVTRHGPLHLYTCFPYESMNRIVVGTINGPNKCEIQASQAIGTYQEDIATIDCVIGP